MKPASQPHGLVPSVPRAGAGPTHHARPCTVLSVVPPGCGPVRRGAPPPTTVFGSQGTPRAGRPVLPWSRGRRGAVKLVSPTVMDAHITAYAACHSSAASRRTGSGTARRTGRRPTAGRRGCPVRPPAASITRMRSASRTVDRRWAMMMDVRPGAVGQGGLDLRLGGGVEVGGGLVEDDDPGPGEQQPGDGEPLAFAAGEAVAALAHRGVGRRAATRSAAPAGRAQGGPQLVVARLGAGETQVLPRCRGTGGRPGSPARAWSGSSRTTGRARRCHPGGPPASS